MIHVVHIPGQPDVVLEFSGALDVGAAEELAKIALQQAPSLHVVIDIAPANTIDDSALGRLLDALPRLHSHSIRGAGRHYARLLQYLGEPIAGSDDEVPHTD